MELRSRSQPTTTDSVHSNIDSPTHHSAVSGVTLTVNSKVGPSEMDKQGGEPPLDPDSGSGFSRLQYETLPKAEEWHASIRKDDSISNTHGLSNKITTTKYTLLTWLPISLFDQFRRIANVYFLLISILMAIGTYAPWIFQTPLEPFSTLGTLIFVLLVTSFKEGYEDYQRKVSDEAENVRKVIVVTIEPDGSFTEKRIENQYVRVGDIVKMEGHTQVAADMVLIITSYFADGNKCYVETANIDGETNLKVREAPAQLLQVVASGEVTPELFSGRVEFEPPDKNIHNFNGALRLDGMEAMSLSADNLLLRGSIFSNTDWGYGVVVYAGQETKVQMNNRNAPSKISKLEEYVNEAIKLIFVAQFILVTISVISVYILGYQYESDLPYVFPPDSDDSNKSALPLWLELWFVFFILYNNFIPISLYVTIELVNLGQAYLISTDLNIYDEALDTPCVVRSSNLAQELGVVRNIFSDKTGTLTRNEMRFVKFVVNDKMYDISDKEYLPKEIQAMQNYEESELYRFFLCLATCHTVVREKGSGVYRAESPDELALVMGANEFQCGVMESGSNYMFADMFGKRSDFDILAVNKFNSDRKRMSILLKDRKTGEYVLMCKGADNVMLERVTISDGERSTIDKYLNDIASLGLRTLVIAQKVIPEAKALEWVQTWKAASTSLQNRSEMLANVAEVIETHMTLLGITAIEDRLQDEVPEVIADLARAGVVLWMLTGDKEETAISIGHSCNLLLPSEEIDIFFITRLHSATDYSEQLQEVYDKVLAHDRSKDIALVMDGFSFTFFDETNQEHRRQLLTIGQACRSVIACRLTPVQKQQLVALVKVDSVPRSTTLSIGDGANDVSMIREADVGIGIIGKEGKQAANNADFAIGQFKFLKTLLLVHGRWNYIRQSRVFLYSMHKNMVLTMTLFWFSYYTALSGTSMYNSWVYSGFNFALGLPIIFYGFMDRDIPAEFAMENPQVYRTGLSNAMLNMGTVGLWITNAMVFAIIFCILFFVVLEPTFRDYGIYEMGTVIYISLVLALQCKVAFLHQVWNKIHVISMIISVSCLFLVIYIMNVSSDEYDYYGVVNFVYDQSIFWFFGVFTIPLFCVLIDVVGSSFYLFFMATYDMLEKVGPQLFWYISSPETVYREIAKHYDQMQSFWESW